jgi:hypothetical protein
MQPYLFVSFPCAALLLSLQGFDPPLGCLEDAGNAVFSSDGDEDSKDEDSKDEDGKDEDRKDEDSKDGRGEEEDED